MNRSGFTPLYLNLDRRPDRRLAFLRQLRVIGISPERIPAPDALSCQDERNWRNTGSRACSIGHRLAWRHAWRSKHENALVLEDDAILSPNFKTRLETLVLPEDWSVCYLGCLFREPPTLVHPGLLRVGATFDMHAYIIRGSFAKILSPALRQPSRRGRGVPVPPEQRTAIDVILSNHHATHAAYAVWPPMAWQAEGLSNIEHSYRGNYHPDGRQRIYEEAIARLPWPYDSLADGKATEQNPVSDGAVEPRPTSANPPKAVT